MWGTPPLWHKGCSGLRDQEERTQKAPLRGCCSSRKPRRRGLHPEAWGGHAGPAPRPAARLPGRSRRGGAVPASRGGDCRVGGPAAQGPRTQGPVQDCGIGGRSRDHGELLLGRPQPPVASWKLPPAAGPCPVDWSQHHGSTTLHPSTQPRVPPSLGSPPTGPEPSKVRPTLQVTFRPWRGQLGYSCFSRDPGEWAEARPHVKVATALPAAARGPARPRSPRQDAGPLTVQEHLELLVVELGLPVGHQGALGALPHGVHEAHAPQRHLLAAALVAEALPAPAAVVLGTAGAVWARARARATHRLARPRRQPSLGQECRAGPGPAGAITALCPLGPDAQPCASREPSS